MAEYLVIADADDGEQNNTAWSVAASNWVPNSSKFAGHDDGRAGIRFQNIVVDPGSTITSATLDLYINRIYREPEMRAHLVDADNAAQFNSGNLPTSNTLTTAFGTYDFDGEGVPTDYTTIGARRVIDVTAVVQEVIDRGGWASSNSLAFVISSLLEGNATWGYVYDSAAGATYEPKLNIFVSGGASTLTADSGSYTVTGTAVALQRGLVMPAGSGSYTVSGTALDLNYGRILSADSGSYAVTGTDATLTYAAVGNYTLSADSGSYAVTGAGIELQRGLILVSDSGSYTVSGTDAALQRGLVLVADSGSYSVSGTSVDLFKGYSLTLDSGAYTQSGTAIDFLTGRVLSAESGSYVYNGANIVVTASGRVMVGRTMYAEIKDRKMLTQFNERKMVI